MSDSSFRQQLHQMADRMADYLEQVDQYPVKAKVQPGEIRNKLPDKTPEKGESFKKVLEDFDQHILPGMTHWQHPRFFGYFPANISEPSVLAEMLTSAMGAQCMSWVTSPAATELEEQMMKWLIELLDLPKHWQGCIQSTASEATLVSLLTARENRVGWDINEKGYKGDERFVIYSSEQVHSSIDKAVRIAGFGDQNLRKISVDPDFTMNPQALKESIIEDLDNGRQPLAVVSVLGTTATTAIDPIADISRIAEEFTLWHHVDAAYAGTAMVLQEYSHWSEGLESVDSFVFNPHKWMGVQFDCSAYFVRDAEALKRTFAMNPSYLQSGLDEEVNNYRDWGIPLGRRFRALKLWFTLRMLGREGIQKKIRHHIELGQKLVKWVEEEDSLELMAPAPLNLVCFRYHPPGISDEEELNRINYNLMEELNNSGEMFLTHAELNGKFVIRWVTGQSWISEEDLKQCWAILLKKLDGKS